VRRLLVGSPKPHRTNICLISCKGLVLDLVCVFRVRSLAGSCGVVVAIAYFTVALGTVNLSVALSEQDNGSSYHFPRLLFFGGQNVSLFPTYILDHGRLQFLVARVSNRGARLCTMCDKTNYGSKIFICSCLLIPQCVAYFYQFHVITYHLQYIIIPSLLMPYHVHH
jgi:hypothetical protein